MNWKRPSWAEQVDWHSEVVTFRKLAPGHWVQVVAVPVHAVQLVEQKSQRRLDWSATNLPMEVQGSQLFSPVDWFLMK